MSTKSAGHAFSLSPAEVLDAVEMWGVRTTGLCYALGSLENRVYEVEREDGSRVVAKFYRPQRHSLAALQDEHRLLAALVEAEVPVCAPLPLPSGATLARSPSGLHFTVFPRVGGRSPDELSEAQLMQLGRLLARMHNVSASLKLAHRPTLSPTTYGAQCLQAMLSADLLQPEVRDAYSQAVTTLVALAQACMAPLETFVVHADCHRGNLLHGSQGWFFLDFDDMAVAPAVQDLWLLLPARPQACPQQVAALVAGYRQFRPLAQRSLRCIEALRGLRYICYAAWIAARWQESAFRRTFEHFGTPGYWQQQTADLHEQIRLLQADDSSDACYPGT